MKTTERDSCTKPVAYPDKTGAQYSFMRLIVERLRAAFSSLPDARKGGNNQRYTIEDAALSVFSVFFMQSPSFLDFQRKMEEGHGESNVQSLFGVFQIPSDNQIRNLLDPVPASTLSPLFSEFINILQ